MRVLARSSALGLALALLAGCADESATPSGPSLSETLGSTGDVQIKRPKLDVTDWVDETADLTLDILSLGNARNIGPGSALLITIPNEGRFGCTANFVWTSGSRTYLGAAGHCFLPAARKSTHGEGADYDASGVKVQVCVEGCDGNFRTSTLVGKFVTLGQVAYARQTDPTGTEDIGNDFGVVEVPASLASLLRPEMPVWGGPSKIEELDYGKYGCHYGNGTAVGEVFLTKARVGVSGGLEHDYWMGDFVASPGDSGSGMVTCESDGVAFHGKGAAGVVTHLGIGTGEVKYKNLKMKVEHGAVFGTTMRRSVEMGREAGLNLSAVLP